MTEKKKHDPMDIIMGFVGVCVGIALLAYATMLVALVVLGLTGRM